MPQLASGICFLFIAWLVVRDCRRRRSNVSSAVWLPIALLLILSSRPVSLWTAGGGDVMAEKSGVTNELGNNNARSPLDQLFFLTVISASFLIANSRGMRWKKLFAGNMPIMLFYLYFALSIVWSGDPGGSLKRLAKDFGLLFVIGLIYTEKDPLQAMRAVFVRTAFVLIPLSVLFVKFYPEYARSYTIAGDIMITGVTTQKNSLGETILLFTLFLVWDYLEVLRGQARFQWTRIPWDRVMLLIMGAWLLHLSQSKTALLCISIGVFLIARSGRLISIPINRAALLGALLLPPVAFFSQKFASVIAPIVEALGRSMTFTGRADIWAHINLSTVNPALGAGYWNFWGGDGGFAIARAMNTGIPNAHNGYVDLYLDGGFIGLMMLLYMLVSCSKRMIKYLATHQDEDRFRRAKFAVLIVAIVYNLSESTFARMGPIWFTALLMMVDYPLTRPIMRKSWTPAIVDKSNGDVINSELTLLPQ